MPQDRTRVRYPIPWIATYIVAAAVVIAGAIAMSWVLEGGSGPRYDYDDPDFPALEAIVQSSSPRRGDFSAVNGGDWRALCLVGAGGDLAGALRRAAIEPGLADAIRGTYESEQDRRELDPTEFALLYVRGDGKVKRLRHPHGFAFARAGAASCLERHAPVLALPIGL